MVTAGEQVVVSPREAAHNRAQPQKCVMGLPSEVAG
jgi:hypothetical protein